MEDNCDKCGVKIADCLVECEIINKNEFKCYNCNELLFAFIVPKKLQDYCKKLGMDFAINYKCPFCGNREYDRIFYGD